MAPELYIITGSNGAGKSTIGPSYLPQHIQETCTVFDGDKLFIQKRNELWQTVQAPKEVRRLAYQFTVDALESEIAEALASKSNYAYEGHFTNDSTWDIPKRFQKNGYLVTLIFFGLKNPDVSQLRVIERTRSGGHWVDRNTIESNFYGNLEKLEQHLDAVNSLYIVDTTEQHRMLAHFLNSNVCSAAPLNELPEWFTDHLPLLTKKIHDVQI